MKNKTFKFMVLIKLRPNRSILFTCKDSTIITCSKSQITNTKWRVSHQRINEGLNWL